MTTYNDYGRAYDYMARCNRLDDAELCLVEGPEDGQYTVMTISEAIEADFAYTTGAF